MDEDECHRSFASLIEEGDLKKVADFMEAWNITTDQFQKQANIPKLGHAWEEYKSPLFVAAYHGHLQVVQFLLSKGFVVDMRFFIVDIDGRQICFTSALEVAAFRGHLKMIKVLLEEHSYWDSSAKLSALFMAIDGGHIDAVEYFIEEGSSLDMRLNESALNHAAYLGKTNICTYLVSKGTNINAIGPEREYNALTSAVVTSHFDTVTELVRLGADLNALSRHGLTAFMIAVRRNDIEMIRRLVLAGADTTIMQKDGCTTLYFAVLLCRLDVLRFLVVDLNQVSMSKERTHLSECEDYMMLAIKTGSLKRVMLLYKAGFEFTLSTYFRLEEMVDAKLEPDKLVDLLRFVRHAVHEPRTLQDICCFKIRSSLGTSRIRFLSRLNLPHKILSFLELKHI